ncbi:gluconate 2-dehydrogenase subunit 3 family protein [Pseudomonas sp. NCHU5208]|uniref:gluconate 2-dehydrogenase subunit 3 family protein n=1 Tax=unclassified Pseudomonas TaxID=196821 RepID=UPI003F9ACCE2
MSARYPDYDVQRKRQGPSWNEPTRQVIDARLMVPREPRFFEAAEWRTLEAICARIVPQPANRPPVPLAALIDGKAGSGHGDGYRDARMPPLAQAWRLGLAAVDAEALTLHQRPFAELEASEQDALLAAMQRGELHHPAWNGMPAKLFFSNRLVHDVTTLYYSHPQSWNDIGFGGPASPRGYVRLASDRRDAWEPAEAHPGQERRARELNRDVR